MYWSSAEGVLPRNARSLSHAEAMARVCTVRLSISLGQRNEVSITQKGVGRKQNGWVGKGAGWMGEVGGKVNG